MSLSIIIYGTTVTPLQLFGYLVALAGLVWYKAGGDMFVKHYTVLKQTLAVWDDEGMMATARGRVIVIVAAVMVVAVVLLLWRGSGAVEWHRLGKT